MLHIKETVSRHKILSLMNQGLKSRKVFWELLRCREQRGAQSELEQILPKGITKEIEESDICTVVDADYPQQLLHLDEPPLALFCRGNRELLTTLPEKLISIVGSRHGTHDALKIASKWSASCVDAGLIVVSGLALGIDGAAHRGALSDNRYQGTIAVLANGVDGFYPSSHQSLHEQIIDQGGLLLSEYPPGTTCHKNHFLERNRIIAALSKLTFVVQARIRSGALVTARLASEIGRDVAAVPWSLSVGAGAGSNQLIQQGGHCVLSNNDLFNLMGMDEQKVSIDQRSGLKMTNQQRALIEILADTGSLSLNELKTKISIDTVEFCDLELRDIIQVDHFGFVSLS